MASSLVLEPNHEDVHLSFASVVSACKYKGPIPFGIEPFALVLRLASPARSQRFRYASAVVA